MVTSEHPYHSEVLHTHMYDETVARYREALKSSTRKYYDAGTKCQGAPDVLCRILTIVEGGVLGRLGGAFLATHRGFAKNVFLRHRSVLHVLVVSLLSFPLQFTYNGSF